MSPADRHPQQVVYWVTSGPHRVAGPFAFRHEADAEADRLLHETGNIGIGGFGFWRLFGVERDAPKGVSR